MNADTTTNPEGARQALRALTDLVCGFARAGMEDGPTQARRFVQRTGVGYSGVAGGFVVKPEMAAFFMDRARMKDGPFRRVNWGPCKAREFWLPSVNETRRTNSNRWGGAQANLGQSENLAMAASYPSASRVVFSMARLDVYLDQISRDLLSDSDLIIPFIDYFARAELRFQVDAALIGGDSPSSNTGGINSPTPLGILNSPASIKVARATGGQIKAADIDALWSSVYGPCKSNAVFHASDEVIQAIDQTAQAGGWAESLYFPQGIGGNEYALIKGRPLIPCESCSALGTPGDICVADWSDYFMYFHRYDDDDSGLAFTVRPPGDSGRSGWGAWGLPSNAVEVRMSDQYNFASDAASFLFKMRIAGSFIWTSPMTNVNGASVGPCAYLSA